MNGAVFLFWVDMIAFAVSAAGFFYFRRWFRDAYYVLVLPQPWKRFARRAQAAV